MNAYPDPSAAAAANPAQPEQPSAQEPPPSPSSPWGGAELEVAPLAANPPIEPGDPEGKGAEEPAADGLPAGANPLDLALTELRGRRDGLLQEITALEQQRDRIFQEIATNPVGQSELIAKRVKGFQAYLVGALQELAAAAEQSDLVPTPVVVQPSPLDRALEAPPPPPPAAAGLFSEDEARVRDALARFGGQPDFYADPWKLRRSLEPAGATLLEEWFLSQGGRGAQPSSGSRNRNVLVAAAAIAILGELYGDRFQTLVLAGQPERLGEWRRGLQDCLGLGREDFGPSSGIVLFERADALIERADRLEERGELPFIVVDAGEPAVAIPVLQFPLWLAFAAAPGEIASEEDLY